MDVDELEIYLTPSGLGRAAIVRRSDGLLCIYVHWLLAEEFRGGSFASGGITSWFNDNTSLSVLYRDKSPERGLYATLEDARAEMHSLRGFSDAILRYSKDDASRSANS
jgi:hypothetical protein